MRNITNLTASGLMLFLTISTLSCATLQLDLPPRFELRKLEISPDKPEAFYEYNQCTRKFLGVCTRNAVMVDHYDLTNAAVRKQMRDAGMFIMVREKP